MLAGRQWWLFYAGILTESSSFIIIIYLNKLKRFKWKKKIILRLNSFLFCLKEFWMYHWSRKLTHKFCTKTGTYVEYNWQVRNNWVTNDSFNDDAGEKENESCILHCNWPYSHIQTHTRTGSKIMPYHMQWVHCHTTFDMDKHGIFLFVMTIKCSTRQWHSSVNI